MKAPATRTPLSMALLALALLTVGVGVYMAFLRPPLLPEDLRALGVDIKALPPSLLRWLSIVFATWGAFITAFGILLLGIARGFIGLRDLSETPPEASRLRRRRHCRSRRGAG
jgi:hypothetical protein